MKKLEIVKINIKVFFTSALFLQDDYTKILMCSLQKLKINWSDLLDKNLKTRSESYCYGSG